MDLSSSTEEEEAASLQHIGSCHGKGVRNKNYHGYTQDDDGNLVRKRCACCDLECRLCKGMGTANPEQHLEPEHKATNESTTYGQTPGHGVLGQLGSMI